jgi:hypothetical protein
MRTLSVVGLMVGVLAGGALAGCHQAPPAAADGAEAAPAAVDIPVRKPGLWKQTMFAEQGDQMQSMTLCLDAAADSVISWWGKGGNHRSCSKNDMIRQPDGSWKFSSVCPGPGGSQAQLDGSVVGDFNTKYEIKAESTLNNSPTPALAGTKQLTIDGEWIGECPAGMRPGDMQSDNGQRINILDLMKAQAKGPKPAQ